MGGDFCSSLPCLKVLVLEIADVGFEVKNCDADILSRMSFREYYVFILV